MINKKLLIILPILLLCASCSLFGKKTGTVGIVKTTNGGADWQFANVYATSTTVSLAGVSISKLDFDPTNRETIFAGSYTDGLYKSTDSAGRWQKILSKISVYDFAIDPANPDTIYAAGICVDHGCVLKTVNSGKSWDKEAFHEGSAEVNTVRSIAINPANPSQLVIGTNSGNIIKSADGGLTWLLLKNFDDRVNRLLWQNGNIYVLLKSKGLFKASGLSDVFTEVTHSLALSNNSLYSSSVVGSFNRVFVDFSTPGLIYMTTDKGLYKTTDEGSNWTLLKLPVAADKVDNQAIAISKSSSNIVYTGVGSTVYKSVDGGASWQTQKVNTFGLINTLLIDPQLPQIAYGGIFGQ